MTNPQHSGPLGAVYEARSADEIAKLYDSWAETYDGDMAQAGYCHPSVCLALLSRHLAPGTSPLLDAGAGTGLMGAWLPILGYPDVDGLDISAGMLAVARKRGIYRDLHQLALGGALPFADEAYGGVVSSGVFTTGHVGDEALPELLRICRTGGVLILSVKTTLWDGGFASAIGGLSASGQVVLLERTEPYVSMPGEAGTVPSLAVALKRTSGDQQLPV